MLFNILVTTHYVTHKISNHIPCEGQLRLLKPTKFSYYPYTVLGTATNWDI